MILDEQFCLSEWPKYTEKVRFGSLPEREQASVSGLGVLSRFEAMARGRTLPLPMMGTSKRCIPEDQQFAYDHAERNELNQDLNTISCRGFTSQALEYRVNTIATI